MILSLSNALNSKFRSVVIALFVLIPVLCVGESISEGTHFG